MRWLWFRVAKLLSCSKHMALARPRGRGSLKKYSSADFATHFLIATANWQLLDCGQWNRSKQVVGLQKSPKEKKNKLKSGFRTPEFQCDYLWAFGCTRTRTRIRTFMICGLAKTFRLELGRKYFSRRTEYVSSKYLRWLTLRKCQGIWLAFMIGRRPLKALDKKRICIFLPLGSVLANN